jgi:hypothetical protein
MTDSNHQPQFKYRNPATGEIIARGPLSLLGESLRAHATAEGAIKAAALAAGVITRNTARADALDQRERDLDAREDAAHAIIANEVARLQDAALKLVHRMDSYERALVRKEIDAAPDPESPEADNLEAALPVPEHRDREELSAILARNRDDEAQEPAGVGVTLTPSQPVANDGFVCGRDRKAARRAWIREQRKCNGPRPRRPSYKSG